MYNNPNLMDIDIALKTMDVDLTIPAENTQEAFQALCNLNAKDDLKSGCIFSSQKLIKPENSTSLAGVLLCVLLICHGTMMSYMKLWRKS